MSRTFLVTILIGAALAAAPAPAALAAPEFVNGLALPGDMLDESKGTDANTGRVGFFSDIYYDPQAEEWWGLSDRGPGGGALPYETRVQRFTLDIDTNTGAITKFKIVETMKFRNKLGEPLDGIAPSAAEPAWAIPSIPRASSCIRSPATCLVSDEYGAVAVRIRSRRDAGARLHDPGEPQAAQRRHGQLQLRRRRRQHRGPAHQPRLRGAGHQPRRRAMSTRCCRARWWTRAAATASAIASSSSTPRPAPPSPSTPTRWRASQGRGISALVAVNDHEFLVLERNNRGIGVGAEADAAEQEGVPHRSGRRDRRQPRDVLQQRLLPATVTKTDALPRPRGQHAARARQQGAREVGRPGHRPAGCSDGSYVMLAGTDNDYSVTQNGGGDAVRRLLPVHGRRPVPASIQCPLGGDDRLHGPVGQRPGRRQLHAPARRPARLQGPAADLATYVSPDRPTIRRWSRGAVEAPLAASRGHPARLGNEELRPATVSPTHRSPPARAPPPSRGILCVAPKESPAVIRCRCSKHQAHSVGICFACGGPDPAGGVRS